jgi:uncharacterized membrane protein
MEKRKQYQLTIISGIILILLAIIYQLIGINNQLISLFFTNLGIIILIIGVLRHNALGAGIKQDELTRKTSALALSYSWLFMFILSNLIFWINHLKVITLNSEQILGIIIFSMPLSVVIFKKFISVKNIKI